MAPATSLCVLASVCEHSTNELIQTISGPLRNKINFEHRLQREEDGGIGRGNTNSQRETLLQGSCWLTQAPDMLRQVSWCSPSPSGLLQALVLPSGAIASSHH